MVARESIILGVREVIVLILVVSFLLWGASYVFRHR